jgi:hypothetical protein
MKTRSSTVPLTVSLPQPVRDAVRRAAYDDNRSVSSFISCLLRAQLEAEGYLERTDSSATLPLPRS